MRPHFSEWKTHRVREGVCTHEGRDMCKPRGCPSHGTRADGLQEGEEEPELTHFLLQISLVAGVPGMEGNGAGWYKGSASINGSHGVRDLLNPVVPVGAAASGGESWSRRR